MAPEATGVPLGVFISDIATAPLPNGDVSGCPWAASAVTLELYPCNTTTSTGLLAVHATVPTQTFPSLLGGSAITNWCAECPGKGSGLDTPVFCIVIVLLVDAAVPTAVVGVACCCAVVVFSCDVVIPGT